MHIYINESQLNKILLNEFNTNNKKTKHELNKLKILLLRDGKLMKNKENSRIYVVYEIQSLTEILGVRYCMCGIFNRKQKDNISGTIMLKPLDLFEEVY